jgi:hypothetical protein
MFIVRHQLKIYRYDCRKTSGGLLAFPIDITTLLDRSYTDRPFPNVKNSIFLDIESIERKLLSSSLLLDRNSSLLVTHDHETIESSESTP